MWHWPWTWRGSLQAAARWCWRISAAPGPTTVGCSPARPASPAAVQIIPSRASVGPARQRRQTRRGPRLHLLRPQQWSWQNFGVSREWRQLLIAAKSGGEFVSWTEAGVAAATGEGGNNEPTCDSTNAVAVLAATTSHRSAVFGTSGEFAWILAGIEWKFCSRSCRRGGSATSPEGSQCAYWWSKGRILQNSGQRFRGIPQQAKKILKSVGKRVSKTVNFFHYSTYSSFIRLDWSIDWSLIDHWLIIDCMIEWWMDWLVDWIFYKLINTCSFVPGRNRWCNEWLEIDFVPLVFSNHFVYSYCFVLFCSGW